eukprot:3063654-Rhodomonas_salina.7
MTTRAQYRTPRSMLRPAYDHSGLALRPGRSIAEVSTGHRVAEAEGDTGEIACSVAAGHRTAESAPVLAVPRLPGSTIRYVSIGHRIADAMSVPDIA